MTTRIGFIGLGVMGRPMAVNLLNSGFDVVVCNRSHGAVTQLVGLGASAAASPAEVAEHSDVVITVLPDSPDVESVVSGADGVLARPAAGLLLIDMSTIL